MISGPKEFSVITEGEISTLRNVALLRERRAGQNSGGCLDEVASESGFPSWAAVERAARFTRELENKLESSLCILLERPLVHAEPLPDWTPVPLLWELRKRDIMMWWRYHEDRSGSAGPNEHADRKSRRQIFIDVPRDYIGMRYTGVDALPAPDRLLPWMHAHGFPYPDLAWMYGKCITAEVIAFRLDYA